MKITEVTITPIAIPDQPLLNTKGVHPEVFLRSVIEVQTDTGLVGLSETYGARRTLEGLRKVAPALIGLDVWNLNELASRVAEALPNAGGINAPTMLADHRVVDVVFGAFEVACLDLQGKQIERPVYELLGGAARKEIAFSGYLFFKFRKPDDQIGEDMFGEVMTPDALVEEAKTLVTEYGFHSLKLKGGVLDPEEEIETMLKLREALPGHPLRIDPMGAWKLETAIDMAKKLEGVLEYLEDPVIGLDAMSALKRETSLPLASNLYVVQHDQIYETVEKNAVQIILSDPHYWRGGTGSVRLGHMCDAAGIGVSMHSNSHLGVSLATMCHVAAATPNLTYDSDTHYPWYRHDIVRGGRPKFEGGKLRVPEGPGLGVALDRDAVDELAKIYEQVGMKDRDDTAEIRKYIPDYVRTVPRW